MDILSTLIDWVFRDAFPAMILMGIVMFVARSVWPWFSGEYWPALRDRENRRTVAQENFGQALIEIRSIAESTATMVQQHDQLIRDIAFQLTGSFPSPPPPPPSPAPQPIGGFPLAGKPTVPSTPSSPSTNKGSAP